MTWYGFDPADERLHVCVGVAGAGKTSLAMDLLEQYLRDGVPWDQIGFLSFSRAACAEAVRRAAKICDEPESRLTEVGWFKTLHGATFRALAVGNKSLLDPDAKDTKEFYEQTFGVGRGGDRGTISWRIGCILDQWDLARQRLWPLLVDVGSLDHSGGRENEPGWENQAGSDERDTRDGVGQAGTGGVSRVAPCVFPRGDGVWDGRTYSIHEKDLDLRPTFARGNPVHLSHSGSSRVKIHGFERDTPPVPPRPTLSHRDRLLVDRCSGKPLFGQEDPKYAGEVIQKYEQAKTLWGKQDFTDLLMRYAGFRAADCLIYPCSPFGTPPEEVQVWFLDEAQDCSALLWAAASRLTSPAEKVHVLGDPWQAVYRFIGAQPDTLLGLAIGSRLRASYTLLARSWRNPDEVLQWGERILEENPAYEARKPFSEKEEGSVGLVQWEEFRSKIGEIAELDTMILARTWFSLGRVQQLLTERGIPWVSVSDRQTSRWDSPVKIAVVLTIRELLAGDRISEQDWRRMTEHFPQKIDGKEIFRRGEKARWKKLECSGEPIKTLDQLQDWGATPEFAAYIRSGGWRTDMLLLLDQAIDRYGIDVVRHPRIKLGTCHSVKGMEARVVYCLASSTDASAAADPEEERNLKYVTITRAIQHYRLVVDQQDVARGKPLFWAAPKDYRTYDNKQEFIEAERSRLASLDRAMAQDPWDLGDESTPDGTDTAGDPGLDLLRAGEVCGSGGEDGDRPDDCPAGPGAPDDHEEWWDL